MAGELRAWTPGTPNCRQRSASTPPRRRGCARDWTRPSRNLREAKAPRASQPPARRRPVRRGARPAAPPPRPETRRPTRPEQAYNAALTPLPARASTDSAVLDLLRLHREVPDTTAAPSAQYGSVEAYYLQPTIARRSSIPAGARDGPTSPKAADAAPESASRTPICATTRAPAGVAARGARVPGHRVGWSGACALRAHAAAGPKEMGGPEMAPPNPRPFGRPGEAVPLL